MSTDRRLVLELLGEGASQAELPRSGVLTIGSAFDKVGFHVRGQGVADVHCAIGRAKGGGFALKDLGSEYGTWVNGERVQQAKLDAGDVILVGSRRLRVVDPAAPVAPATPVAPAAPAAAAAPASSAISTSSATQATATSGAPAPTAAAAFAAPRASPENAPASRPAAAATTYETSPFPRIPGYKVEKLLGRGGMGEVFLATQERLARKVALKLLSARLCADADFVRRFQDEARAAAALSHPNVVVVHDVGVEAGRPYLSMEFMDHGTLETRVARGARMGWQEVLAVLHDIASALVYAESRGIVHRDIKPANLMQGAAGATKLADLGLATQIEAEASESENGRIFGTPHFISPEQARGERVDGRSDLYSLGATAYRLLSGRTPFEGATTRDILRGHFTEKPKSLAELDPTIPAELVRIVERLLEKRPDDRFPSAAVLLQEVDRVRASLLHGEGAAGRSGASPKVLVAGVFVALAAVAAWWFARRDEPDVRPPAPLVVPTPPALVEPPVDPKPPKQRPGDDETRMKLFEAEAKLAWRDLPSGLVGAERAARLEQLSLDYAGTTAAVDMQSEAEAIRADLQREHAANAKTLARRAGALQALEAAAAPHADDPARALAALGRVPLAPEVLEDPEFAEARAEVYERALARGLEAASAESRAIDGSAARGDFADVARRIDELLPKLELPPLPEDPEDPEDPEGPEGTGGLAPARLPAHAVTLSLARELRARREGLEAERARHALLVVDADRARVAAALGVNPAFERELRALDFAALHARFAELETALATEPARAVVRDLDRDLASGRAALGMLAVEFAKGGWKRKQVADPRGSRASVRDAVGVDADGVTLEVDGKPDTVPWSAFGGKPEKLSFLFNQRLTRDYTPEEARGIEALVRTAAVLAAVEAASEMFDPAGGARFDDGEQRELVAAFDWGKAWATAAGTLPRYERESAAATLLARSLLDASNDAWSGSVAGLDRLIAEYGDTLLVRMLSDGKPRPVH